jgi:hypothetical protein
MRIKNTYGISVTLSEHHPYSKIPKSEFTGSALQRKKQTTKPKRSATNKSTKNTEKKLRFMSKRTKQKIRKKIMCFTQGYKHKKRLSFVTLTFLNSVTDEKAIVIFRKFLDNVKKRSQDFQYVWVVERQTRNNVFKNNIHFHMITNKQWKIKKWWNYWMDLQIKNGIKPRSKDFRPTSAFDVKQLSTNNVRGLISYVTKYITKNNDKFKCQVWNCSKKVSHFYTDIYTTEAFIEQFKKLNAISKEYIDKNSKSPVINVKMIDLNRQTLPLYKRLDDKNRLIIFDK